MHAFINEIKENTWYKNYILGSSWKSKSFRFIKIIISKFQFRIRKILKKRICMWRFFFMMFIVRFIIKMWNRWCTMMFSITISLTGTRLKKTFLFVLFDWNVSFFRFYGITFTFCTVAIIVFWLENFCLSFSK